MVHDFRVVNHTTMFDFSRFTDRTDRISRGTFQYANFTEEQIAEAIATPGGLYLALRELNDKLVKKGAGPNAAAKGLIVFQAQGFNTTFQDIAMQIGVKSASAYSYSNVFRAWLRDAFCLECVVEGDNIRLADPESGRQKALRLNAAMEKLNTQWENLDKVVTSLHVTGQAVVLPPQVQLHLEAHKNAKLLAATNSDV